MKSVVKTNIQYTQEFPKLMQFEGIVVLFTSKYSGTVVGTGQKSSYCLGEHSCDWDIGVFKPFSGTIELSN